ncbi:MAG: hypothetical protein QM523_07490 [Candidatus Pacebacteria bacterium]|nr:hypothetical protein [Candidatus Paceibacterota bacterium]
MKTLKTLIRVHEWHLEEKRRILVELETKRESILARLAKLEAEIAAEKAFVAQQVDDQYRMSALDFSYYHEDAKEKRADIQLELKFNGEAIAAAQIEVTAAYQELKKYETALEQRVKREALIASQKEQIRLDDMAIEGFRRRKVGG